MHLEIRAHPTKTWGVTFGVEGKGISGRENSKADLVESEKKGAQMDFPRGPVVKNLPASTGGHGFKLWSGKIPQAAEQLSLCTRAWNCNYRTHVPQLLKPTCPRTCALQQEKPPHLEKAHLPQPEKAHEPQQRPSIAINKQTEGSFLERTKRKMHKRAQ